MAEPKPFAFACVTAGLAEPTHLLRAFDATAQLLGEPVTVTDRQARRRRQDLPLPTRTLREVTGLLRGLGTAVARDAAEHLAARVEPSGAVR
ncbi:hypothetical protein [Streptomyces fumanus]|uniref:hypothetical protein n=1 Tax=Streptomyces fumanus TaxID=67302 RepID=UPI0033E56FD9